MVEQACSAFNDESNVVAPQNADFTAHPQATAKMVEFEMVTAQTDFDGVAGLIRRITCSTSGSEFRYPMRMSVIAKVWQVVPLDTGRFICVQRSVTFWRRRQL